MSNNYFKTSLDQMFTQLLKQAGEPPPLPADVMGISPWDEVEGEEKPIGLMTKEELAKFITNLDDKTFDELKIVLDKVEMPAEDDKVLLPEYYDDRFRKTYDALPEATKKWMENLPVNEEHEEFEYKSEETPISEVEDLLQQIKQDIIPPEVFWAKLQNLANKTVSRIDQKLQPTNMTALNAKRSALKVKFSKRHI